MSRVGYFLTSSFDEPSSDCEKLRPCHLVVMALGSGSRAHQASLLWSPVRIFVRRRPVSAMRILKAINQGGQNTENNNYKKAQNMNARNIVLAACLMLAGNINNARAAVSFPEKGTTALLERQSHQTPAQREWLNASTGERILIAEKLGENGAMRWARKQGWQPLIESGKRTVPQGPDMVYRAGDGIVHVIEAKGGSGQLGHAYGHPQGSPEWAVKSAERILKSQAANPTEKLAAQAVVEAARDARLQVHVVRTSHILGEPTGVALEQTLRCSKGAAQLASSIAEGGIAKPAQLAGDVETLGSRAAITRAGSAGENAGVAAAESGARVGAILTKVGGAAAGAAGAVQVMDGYHNLRNGENAEAAFNLTEGTANLASGGLMAGGRLAAGGALGGAAAILDGGHDVYQGIEQGNHEKIGVGSAKSAGGAMMLAGLGTAQPEVVLVGVGVYVVAVGYENREVIGEAAEKASDVCVETTKGGFVTSEDWLINSTSEKTQQTVLDHTPRFIKNGYFAISDLMRR